jgi:hypothetical protein
MNSQLTDNAQARSTGSMPINRALLDGSSRSKNENKNAAPNLLATCEFCDHLDDRELSPENLVESAIRDFEERQELFWEATQAGIVEFAGKDTGERNALRSGNVVPQSNPASANFSPQPVADFLKLKLPPKEALIDGILHRRDQISLTGRRRNGKTTLLHNLAIAGALGRKEYLGFPIPRPFKTVSFYLEDDAGEMQGKLSRMLGNETTRNFHLYSRSDFFAWKIPIDVKNKGFQNRVIAACDVLKPDLIIFDNLGMLIGADYNNSKDVHALMDFVFLLAQKFNAAVLIAAHPRKGSGLDKLGNKISLATDTERFFEETMGTSHFVNSTGSLWGMERNGEMTTLLLGAQRLTGQQTLTVVEKSDNEWFVKVDDRGFAYGTVCNTPKRESAWKLLPEGKTFSYIEARELVKTALSSSSSFNAWWKELRRNMLVVEEGTERYRKGFKLPTPKKQGAK